MIDKNLYQSVDINISHHLSVKSNENPISHKFLKKVGNEHISTGELYNQIGSVGDWGWLTGIEQFYNELSEITKYNNWGNAVICSELNSNLEWFKFSLANIAMPFTLLSLMLHFYRIADSELNVDIGRILINDESI